MNDQQLVKHYRDLFNAEVFKNEVQQHKIKELDDKISLLNYHLKHKDKLIKQQTIIIQCFQNNKVHNNRCTYIDSDGDETTIYIKRFEK